SREPATPVPSMTVAPSILRSNIRGGPRHGPPHPPTLGAPRVSRGAPRSPPAAIAGPPHGPPHPPAPRAPPGEPGAPPSPPGAEQARVGTRRLNELQRERQARGGDSRRQ